MRMPHNIEKSPFHGRQYTGYGSRRVWLITGRTGEWRATVDPRQVGVKYTTRCADTLAELSALIDQP